jgi:hypothetical protein
MKNFSTIFQNGNREVNFQKRVLPGFLIQKKLGAMTD